MLQESSDTTAAKGTATLRGRVAHGDRGRRRRREGPGPHRGRRVKAAGLGEAVEDVATEG